MSGKQIIEESLSDDTETEVANINISATEENELASEVSASEEENPWISWFVNIRGNEFFCAVDEDFIQDDFNLTGLNSTVPYYDYALDMILDLDLPLESLTEEQQDIVETAAEVLYGLIHARYLITGRGMQKMFQKFSNCDFGRCPRVHCKGQATLPVGLSDLPRLYPVNIYCPRCQEVYYPRSSKHANIDGAYFGTTFAHLYLLNYPESIPSVENESYIPRIFGFKINQKSSYYTLRHKGLAVEEPIDDDNGQNK